jgi:hypothetical protein
MCFSRIKNIKSLTSKNSSTLIVIKPCSHDFLCKCISDAIQMPLNWFPQLFCRSCTGTVHVHCAVIFFCASAKRYIWTRTLFADAVQCVECWCACRILPQALPGHIFAPVESCGTESVGCWALGPTLGQVSPVLALAQSPTHTIPLSS